MTLHNKPEYNTPQIVAALEKHGMETNQPSQLADAFRLGWVAAKEPTEDDYVINPLCECGMTGPCMWDECKAPIRAGKGEATAGKEYAKDDGV